MACSSLKLPLTEDTARALVCGQRVLLSGPVFTARDAAHKFLAATGPDNPAIPPGLIGGAVYHCGPVTIRDEAGRWQITAAGPTTSSRENTYMPEVIRRYGLRVIIGKGGMDAATVAACQRYGCVYLQAVGGAAQVLAEAIVEVAEPYFLQEFGAPEAIWPLQVRDFPAIVSIDAQGHSLHEETLAASRQRLQELLAV